MLLWISVQDQGLIGQSIDWSIDSINPSKQLGRRHVRKIKIDHQKIIFFWLTLCPAYRITGSISDVRLEGGSSQNVSWTWNEISVGDIRDCESRLGPKSVLEGSWLQFTLYPVSIRYYQSMICEKKVPLCQLRQTAAGNLAGSWSLGKHDITALATI